eukprot:1147420-Pelagomonas_calceolata.AAC.6
MDQQESYAAHLGLLVERITEDMPRGLPAKQYKGTRPGQQLKTSQQQYAELCKNLRGRAIN